MISVEDTLQGKSDFVRVDRDPVSKNAIIAFSHLGYPRGKFAMSHALEALPATKIYVNCHENSWYVAGLGYDAPNVDATRKLLSSILKHVGAERTITVGMSMGGYGALLYGMLLKCTYIVAFTTEITIGEEYGRSYTVNGRKVYDVRYRSLANEIHQNKSVKTFLIYGAYDSIDLSLLWPIANEIEKRDLIKTFFVSGDHKVPISLDVPSIVGKALEQGSLTSADISSTRCFDHNVSALECYAYNAAWRLQGPDNRAKLYTALKAVPEALKTSWMILVFGQACFDLKKHGEGLQALRLGVELDPNWQPLQHALAMAYQAENEPALARDAYRRCLELRPDAVTSRYRLANVLAQLGEFDQAENEYSQVIAEAPQMAEAAKRLRDLAVLQKQK